MTDDGEVEIFNRIAKIGPFPDKVIARRYAFENDMRFGPKQPKEKDDVSRINYPIFIFDYEMAGVDCMDIIIAETKESAMKLFATQWKMFDNSKVYR